jgi:hypothetical protein
MSATKASSINVLVAELGAFGYNTDFENCFAARPVIANISSSGCCIEATPAMPSI